MKILLTSWAYGLWTAGPVSQAPPGTLTRVTNMVVDEEGVVKSRPGTYLHANISDTTDALFTANRYFYKRSDNSIYDGMTDAGFDQSGRYIRAVTTQPFGCVYDVVYFPTVMYKRYNGVSQEWGISEVPTAITAADSGAAGNLTGTYTYMITFYNDTTKTESAPSVASTAAVISAGTMTLTAFPTTCADSQVTHIRIYRTSGYIDGVWYYVDKVGLGTLTYTDEVSDLGLGSILDTITVNVPSANVAAIQGRRVLLFDVAGHSRYVYYTNSHRPEITTELQYELVSELGDKIVAALPYGEGVVAFGRRNVYECRVSADGYAYTARLPVGRGTVNGRTVALGYGGIYFQSDDGIYVLSGYNATRVSTSIDTLFKGIDRGGLGKIYDAEWSNGTYIAGTYYFTYYGTDKTWHTLAFDEKAGRWHHHTGWTYTAIPSEGTLPIVGTYDNIQRQNYEASQDYGTPFTSSCAFNLTLAETVLHTIRFFRLNAECSGVLTVSFYDDDVLVYERDIDSVGYEDSYTKYALPLGTYFNHPEVRFSSTSPLVLRAFETDIYTVRKVEADFSRQPYQAGSGAGASTPTQ